LNCAYHGERVVHGICNKCGRPICEECLVDINGQVYCKACLEVNAVRRTPTRDNNSSVRFILSFMPGLAHLYLGLFNRGLQMMVGFIGGAIILGNLFEPLIGFWIPAGIFFSIFDAREVHLRMAQGLEVEDKGFVDPNTLKMQWRPQYVGYILIGIGVLVLFNVMMEDLLRLLVPSHLWYRVSEAIRGSILGIGAIAGGLWMLRRNRNNSNW